MTAIADADRLAANQRCLCAEFARLRARLSGDRTESPGGEEHPREAPGEECTIDAITRLFGLTRFERDVLLLCAAVEMEPDTADCCGAAHGGTQQRYVTLGLALSVLGDPHWSALTPGRPLRRWRLVEGADEFGLTASRLRIDERILHYLAGINEIDRRLLPFVGVHEPSSLVAASHADVAKRVTDRLMETGLSAPVVQFSGDDLDGQRDVADHVAKAQDLQLHVLRSDLIPSVAQEMHALAALWNREALLLPSALLITCGVQGAVAPVANFVERLCGLVFIATAERLPLHRAVLRFEVNRPDASERKRLWQQTLASSGVQLNGALDQIVWQFSLSARTIQQTATKVMSQVDVRHDPVPRLWSLCRESGRGGLDHLAQRIEPSAGWSELVLPRTEMDTLALIAAHVRHRSTVNDTWGFAAKSSRGLGISVLFAGESGTGKTMAAEVLARELNLDLYRIDLSFVVSKYIGETEKNLARVFAAAEHSGAILLFDEADALFGKRSEVRDSHDRYANIEVSYLLQQMESYRGLAILTTNAKAALDRSFERRLRFIVHFSFPDRARRELIWRGVFPAAAPLRDLDYARLARLHVSGGSIRSIALTAAFLAAEDREPIAMNHLARAARAEGEKRERPLTEADTRDWV
jgi:hypothetical protein